MNFLKKVTLNAAMVEGGIGKNHEKTGKPIGNEIGIAFYPRMDIIELRCPLHQKNIHMRRIG